MDVLMGIAKAARENSANDEAAIAAVNKALSVMENTGYGSDDSEPEVVFAADPNRQQPMAVAAATIALPQELSMALKGLASLTPKAAPPPRRHIQGPK